MTMAAVIFIAGMSLSAFFSGSETGFYRATRLRLVLDALDGDWVARSLLWLMNNPALFVATTLIGNNVANYAISFAIVILVNTTRLHDSVTAEIIAPVALSPLIFVYAESLPKTLFLKAPNQMLRRCGPAFLLFAVLFAPVSLILWFMALLLQFVLGETPLRAQLTLAREELRRVLQEGQEAGILRPSQRHLAQNLIAIASRHVGQICTPLGRVPTVPLGAQKSEVLRIARRQRASLTPVTRPGNRSLIGYVRLVDLRLGQGDTVESARPLIAIPHNTSHISALIRMQSARESLARVVDDSGATVGLLYASQLSESLFRSS